MESIGSFWNSLIVFFAAIWPLLWVLYEIRQVRKHMAKGRTIGGAIIAEIGTLIGAPLISIAALWIIFSVATPTLEDQGRRYAGQSQTGQILFGCLNSGGDCLQIGEENAPIPTANFFPTPTTSVFFPTSTPTPAATEPPATAPIIPTDPNSPPVATETPTAIPPVSGPPDPGLFVSNAEMAACTTRALTTIGFWTLTEGSIQEPSTGYLPIGSNWEISSPNWIGHVWPTSGNEEWTLCSLDYPGACSTISGDLARSLGGEVNLFQNRKAVQVTGTGQLPETCWYLANPTP